jgi:hypothetical protein
MVARDGIAQHYTHLFSLPLLVFSWTRDAPAGSRLMVLATPSCSESYEVRQLEKEERVTFNQRKRQTFEFLLVDNGKEYRRMPSP